MATESGPGILQLIRMMLDPKSAKDTQQQMQDALAQGTNPAAAKANAGAVGQAMEMLKSKAKALGIALAAAFGLRAAFRFGKEAIAAAIEARKEWALLSNALQNVGVDFKSVRGEVEHMAKAFQTAGIMGDEEFASTLRTLTQLSGDYSKSLANVQVVADFAAARQLDLETAAVLVGKAMNGNVEMLARYGIEVKKGEDGVRALADQFRNAAIQQDEAARNQKRISEEWGDFKETLGDALMSVKDGGGLIETLSKIIRGLTKVVADNKEGIGIFGSSLTWLVRGPLWAVLKAYEGWARLLALIAEGLAKISPDKYAAGLEAWAAKAETAADAAGKLASAVAGTEPGKPTGGKLPTGPIGGAVTMAGMNKAKDKTAEELLKEEDQKRQERIDAAKDALDFDTLRQEGLSKLIALQDELNAKLADENITFEEKVVLQKQLKDVQDGVLDGLKRIANDAGITESALEQMMKGSASGALKEIAKEAKGRAAWNVAKAIEEFARAWGWIGLGNFASAGAAKTSATMHLSSASKWAALAGGAGLGGGGGGGPSSGGGGAGPENLGSDAATEAKRPATHVTVYVDGMDPDNPRHQDLNARINRKTRERYGEDATVTIVNGVPR